MDNYTNNKISDIDLSKSFGQSVFYDYEIAVEFITVNPDYSLLKFREILTFLCKKIAKEKNIIFKSDQLFTEINTLFKNKAISEKLKDTLHKARQDCNTGVHKPQIPISERESEFQQKVHNDLIEKARNVRLSILEIYKDTYSILNPGKIFPEYYQTTEGVQENRELLMEGINTISSRKKYKAGLLCESLAKQSLIGQPLIVSSNFNYHYKSLYKLAANFYEASYKISADIDVNSRNSLYSNHHELSNDELIYKYADAESLFRFARIASQSYLGEDQAKKSIPILKLVADKGHGDACAYYGGYLYDESKNYNESLNYLTKAADNNIQISFIYLWHYYTDGKCSKPDYEKAFYWLNKGIELGYPDALCCLGISYHKGIYFQKDDKKAEKILKDAIEKGSEKAYRYYMIEFNDLSGKVALELKKFGEAIEEAVQEFTENSSIRAVKNRHLKIGRNQPCPCGSGKKYKKCCLNKPNQELIMDQSH